MKVKQLLKGLAFFVAGGLLSLVVLGIGAYISNLNLPTGPQSAGRLDELDKTRLAESLQLKAALGEGVWPGWGRMDVPILLWNRENSYLLGLVEPPDGWERVPDDLFQGASYYRNPRMDPENFALYIGDQWVASMATKVETDLFLQKVFREAIPDRLEPFFPFRLLVLTSEFQISGVLHETFHVYQANQVPEKFAQAQAVYQHEKAYWLVDPKMGPAWQDEMGLLIEATEAETRQESLRLVSQFLSARDRRRAGYALTPGQVSFEMEIEWLEGLAKYVELSIWEAASTSSHYQPMPQTQSDPDFKDYHTFNGRWRQEISQARRQAAIQSDVRFYYCGMLQARILDKVFPGWKEQTNEDGVYLEDLLRTVRSP